MKPFHNKALSESASWKIFRFYFCILYCTLNKSIIFFSLYSNLFKFLQQLQNEVSLKKFPEISWRIYYKIRTVSYEIKVAEGSYSFIMKRVGG